MTNDPSQPQPEITYPTKWSYRIVGTSEAELRQTISQILDEFHNQNNNPTPAHTIKTANQSTNGKYLSLNLEITVQTEDHRLQIFNALSTHPKIRYVL